jgi:hypothetical protein
MHKVVFLLVVAYLMIPLPLPLPLTVLIIKTSSVRTVCTTDIAGGIQYKCGAIIEIYKIPSNTLFPLAVTHAFFVVEGSTTSLYAAISYRR